MKKILMLMAVVCPMSMGIARAQSSMPSAPTAPPSWEYALYTSIPGIEESWTTPAGSVTGKDIDAIIAGIKCGNVQGIDGLLNCVGDKGWELVQVTEDSGQITVKNYIFKRRKN